MFPSTLPSSKRRTQQVSRDSSMQPATSSCPSCRRLPSSSPRIEMLRRRRLFSPPSSPEASTWLSNLLNLKWTRPPELEPQLEWAQELVLEIIVVEMTNVSALLQNWFPNPSSCYSISTFFLRLSRLFLWCLFNWSNYFDFLLFDFSLSGGGGSSGSSSGFSLLFFFFLLCLFFVDLLTSK